MDTVRGISTPPWVVGLVRGILEAAVAGGVAYAIFWLDVADLPEDVAVWAPVLVLILRTIEGGLDQMDSAKAEGHK